MHTNQTYKFGKLLPTTQKKGKPRATQITASAAVNLICSWSGTSNIYTLHALGCRHLGVCSMERNDGEYTNKLNQSAAAKGGNTFRPPIYWGLRSWPVSPTMSSRLLKKSILDYDHSGREKKDSFVFSASLIRACIIELQIDYGVRLEGPLGAINWKWCPFPPIAIAGSDCFDGHNLQSQVSVAIFRAIEGEVLFGENRWKLDWSRFRSLWF